jgi:Resolvase, N terminal domain
MRCCRTDADGIDLTSDDDDPTRRLIRQVLGAVSEFEKRVIVLKLRAARERKRRRGERVEGVKPYGTLPAEQAVLERMRRLRRKPPKGRRPSVAQVAALLNAEGHRNRAGREWSPQMVHHVLRPRRTDTAPYQRGLHSTIAAPTRLAHAKFQQSPQRSVSVRETSCDERLQVRTIEP